MAFTLSLGNLEIHLLADNSKLAKTIRGTDALLKQTEKNFKKFGSTMTKYITLPLTAVGAASIKAFADFECKAVPEEENGSEEEIIMPEEVHHSPIPYNVLCGGVEIKGFYKTDPKTGEYIYNANGDLLDSVTGQPVCPGQ